MDRLLAEVNVPFIHVSDVQINVSHMHISRSDAVVFELELILQLIRECVCVCF